MPLVDEDAGDPPLGQRWRILVVLALVLDARKLLRTAVLAPALGGAVLVEDQRGWGAPGGAALSLGGAVVAPPRRALGVVADAPAAAVHAIVALDELGEGFPRRPIEMSDRIGHGRIHPILGTA